MREDPRDYGATSAGGTVTTLHWHDGGTCHGSSTMERCAEEAIANGWTGKVLEREDAYRSGERVKCYSLIASGFDHHGRCGKYVAEVKVTMTLIVDVNQGDGT